MPLFSTIVAITLYALGFYLHWKRRDRVTSNRLILGITVAAVVFHGITAYALLAVDGGVDLGLVPVCTLVAFILVLVVALANFRLPIENLYIFLFPISIVVLLIALWVEPGNAPLEALSTELLIHIFVSLAAYSALMMAACQSLLLALQERSLRQPGKSMPAILPPLETMERLLFIMLWIGLALLSAAIASGYLFLDDIFARQVLHHIVLTSLSWGAYVFFLSGHYLFGWRGLTAVRWTLVAFSMLLLGYLGSKFVTEYLL